MVIEIILVLIVLLYLIFATISDIKTREVPDWLNYSLIIIALFLKSIDSIISKDVMILVYGLIGFGVFFGIANLMYYTRQWGGGDAKLLMGLGAAFPTYPTVFLSVFNPTFNNIPFLVTLIINIFVIGAIYGLLYSVLLVFKNRKDFSKNFNELINEKKVLLIRKIVLIVCIVSIILIFGFLQDLLLKILLSSICLFLLAFVYLWVFIKSVELSCMYKYLETKKLREGDWIVNKIVINKKLIYNPKSLGVEKKQIALIQKSKIKKVLVKEGIPFVPPFLIAFIISIIFGNIILILI